MMFLGGCDAENRELHTAMEFRDMLLAAESCSFSTGITADYGDSLQHFSMSCEGDSSGNLSFQITAPDSIAGIQGEITDGGGRIIFEDEAVFFPLMTDDLLVPASAPWIFLKTLRSGYLTSACMEDELLHITVDDSYDDDALTLDIWFNGNNQPVRSDILHDGKRILSLEVENFVFS